MLVDIREAILALRQSLGDSQQAFATRLGISIRAVANYEKDRRPNFKSLTALENLAESEGFSELAVIFSDALREEIHYRSGKVGRVLLHLVRSQVELSEVSVDELPTALAAQVAESRRLAWEAMKAFAKSDLSTDSLKIAVEPYEEFIRSMEKQTQMLNAALEFQNQQTVKG